MGAFEDMPGVWMAVGLALAMGEEEKKFGRIDGGGEGCGCKFGVIGRRWRVDAPQKFGEIPVIAEPRPTVMISEP